QSILTLMKLDNVIEKDFTVVHPEMSLGQMLHEGVAKSSRNLFPVVDEQHYLVGIIFLDDIRTVMFDSSLHDTTSVETFMHNPAEHIHFEMDSVKDVMRKFQDTGAWNLPVIRNNKYYGIVSKSKLLTAYRRELINFTA
ncbi:MAG: CBS domain-containing protein, partial [Psychroserpens sp.]|nr:CBS domain-containing protein [Psychroserpens sp.]